MKADAQTEAAVLDVLTRIAESYAKRDMVGLLSCVAPDADVIMYGTGADEKNIGADGVRAQAERDWSQTEESKIVYTWTSVSAAGPVAWAATDAVFQLRADGGAMTLPARITSVFENRAGKWLMVQGHFSLPAAGQEDGEAFPT